MTDYSKMSDEELRNEVARVLGYVYAAVWWKPDGTLAGTLPKWSTSIADAWELVSEMVKAGHDVEVFCATKNDKRCFCRVDEDTPENGATAPRAICLAFLQSKGK